MEAEAAGVDKLGHNNTPRVDFSSISAISGGDGSTDVGIGRPVYWHQYYVNVIHGQADNTVKPINYPHYQFSI